MVAGAFYQTMKPLAITTGEPAGIGPDLILSIASQSLPNHVVIADPALLARRAEELNLAVTIKAVDNPSACHDHEPGQLQVYPIRSQAPTIPGKPDKRNADYVLNCLELAAQGCLQGKFAAVITGPVHKAIMNEANIPFTGQTEFFAQQCHVKNTVMMLTNSALRVALATTHLPLKEISQAITEESITAKLQVLHDDLITKFNIPKPHILVSGLNPHAGEQGHLGREEIDIIEPSLEKLRQQGYHLTGPLPADTLFTEKYLSQADAVFAMYHDQGLPVLKYAGFGQGVNITLGLPIIRTSVDHGTACDLAGTGKASPDSLLAAIHCATQLVKNYDLR